MQQLLHILILATAMMGFCMSTTGCIDDDYTTSPSDILTFSTDTLRFDTIFTDLRTPTASFMVYNRSKKMLSISSITVGNYKDNARFRINVDGINDESFSNVDIRGGDSIFVFVEAYIDHNDSDLPLEVEDKITFITNGVQQQVILSAWGQDATRLRKHTVSSDTTFTAERPIVVFDTLTVAEGATLTIDSGANVYFHDKAMIMVNGTLKALGHPNNGIVLRGDRTDKVVGGIDFDIMSGQWNGIRFGASSSSNVMQYVDMRASSTGITLDSCSTDATKLHIFNSILHNSAGSVLTASHCKIEVVGTELSDAALSVVDITGGIATFTNCTLANQYLFSAIGGSIISLDYIDPKLCNGDAALGAIEFNNCIVHGNTSDINEGDLTGTSVFIRNTVLRSKGENDDNFIDCVWEGDPQFYTVRKDYIFDYRINEKSDAAGIAKREFIPDYAMTDRYGINRLRTLPDGGITFDAGAYCMKPLPADADK